MLRDTNFETSPEEIDKTCPCCGPDAYKCPAHSTRDSQAGMGTEAESYDRDSQISQSDYDAGGFTSAPIWEE
jgi:hypothetical protein